ncbi:Na/Pi cotransporter family protein [Paenibacillus sp. NPDC058071]|uniref:Na/Pi cotransporter family protein n=1 Tax=Paenibacillus sp. NPDC058071 TaxID=3346326 RepID=UPI0036D89404
MLHSIVLPMAIGFTIFLGGMKLMELALHRLAGPQLGRVLHRSTTTPGHGLIVGTATTAFLQSSTAVTVIAIGLVNARLLTFPRTLGIILGTNIGTCLTTELIGLRLNELAFPLLAISAALWLVTVLLDELQLLPLRTGARKRVEKTRFGSVALGGFSLLLTGMALMQSIGPAVQSSPLFDWFLAKSAENLWWALAAGAVLTAIVHSSSAVIGIVMGFASIDAMPPELCVAIVLGANVGTCVTALLASIGGSKGGKLVALSHIVLNAGGALLFMPFVGQLTALSGWLAHSPASQIAHAQTIFNLASSLLALPLCYLPVFKRMQLAD